MHETQVSRDERNEYFGITLERAAKILDALHVRLRTQVAIEPLPPFSHRAAIMTASSRRQHEMDDGRRTRCEPACSINCHAMTSNAGIRSCEPLPIPFAWPRSNPDRTTLRTVALSGSCAKNLAWSPNLLYLFAD